MKTRKAGKPVFLTLGDTGKKKGNREIRGRGKLSDVCPNFSSPGFCVEMTEVHHIIGGNNRDWSYLGPCEEAQNALFSSVTPGKGVVRQEALRCSFPGKPTVRAIVAECLTKELAGGVTLRGKVTLQ